jgi:hypothetical protein
MLPRLDMFKAVLFTKRIVVFNESFVPLGTGGESHCVPYAALWHEAIAGRKKENLISTFQFFLLTFVMPKKVTL